MVGRIILERRLQIVPRGNLPEVAADDKRARGRAAADDQVPFAGFIAEVQRDAVLGRPEVHDEGHGVGAAGRRERTGSRIRRELRRVDGVRPADRTRRIRFGSFARERDGRRALVRRGETIRRWLGFEVPPDRRHKAGDVRICGKSRSCKQHSSHRAKRPGGVSMTMFALFPEFETL